MAAKDSPEELPAGWTVLSKVLRTGRTATIYTNVETGKRFFSKDDLFKYIKSGSSPIDKPPTHKKDTAKLSESTSSQVSPQTHKKESISSQVSPPTTPTHKKKNTSSKVSPPTHKKESVSLQVSPPTHKKDSEKCPESTSSQVSQVIVADPLLANKDNERQEESTSLQPELVNANDDRPEWLPVGWKVEVKIRKSGVHNGKEYKCYIDPSNSGKFYSKLEVLRYLETIKRKKGTHEDVSVNQESSVIEKKTGTSILPVNKVVVQKCDAEDLPTGWIKEIKIKQTANGIRKDPFYTDPVSGYVFRSKKDALRYIQSGELSRHAFKPKKLSNDSPELIKEEISKSSAAKRQKIKHPNKQQLSPAEKGSEKRNLEQSKTEYSTTLNAEVPPEASVAVSSGEENVNGKRSSGDSTQECVQSKKLCTPNSSLFAREKEEVSSQCEDSTPPLSGAGECQKNRAKQDIAENGPVSTPAPEIIQDKKFVETVTARVSGKNTQVGSKKAIDKKISNLPPRSSKRLAGHEPEKVANLELGERALISSVRKSRNTRNVKDAHLTSDDLVDGSSVTVQVQLRPEAESADQPPSKGNKQEDKSPMKRTEPHEQQVAPEELYHKLEKEKENDDSEPQLSFLFGSDPCLEFAFKTLMGDLPLDDTSLHEPALSNVGSTVTQENLHASETKKSSAGKGHSGKGKPRNKKELNVPRRSSKRLAGGEPEVVLNSSTSEASPQNSIPEPFGQGSISTTDFLDKTNKKVGPGTMADLANKLFSNSAERTSKRDKSLENPASHSEQPQKRETGKAQLEKPEPPQMHENGKIEIEKQIPDLSFSIADYWSDPCLDFAFKTLTGAIPIEDSLVQNYFQDQVDLSNKNGCTMLPDFGSSSLFQTDISPQFDVPESSLAGQLGSVTNVSFSSCSGVHSQQQPIEGNNDLNQKVKS